MVNPPPEQQNVTDAVRGVRTLEEKYNNLLRRVQVGEQNHLSNNKKVHTELKTLNSEILDLKKQIDEIREKLVAVIKELSVTSKKEEVDVLKKYMDLWDPINFVTQKEVENIVRRVLEEKK